MKTGLVTWWFNRGQAVVSRTLVSALASLGHEVHVLARPTSPKFWKPGFIDRSDDWYFKNLTLGSSPSIPPGELLSWAQRNALEVVFFDQNYDFDAIKGLRNSGVRTIGRFVWEEFAPRHLEPALGAFDIIYSLTNAEKTRYLSWGLESPLLRFPALGSPVSAPSAEDWDIAPIIFNAGYLSDRKPLGAVISAFKRSRVVNPLIVKAQRTIRKKNLSRAKNIHQIRAMGPFGKREVNANNKFFRGRGIQFLNADLPALEMNGLLSGAVALATPTRWEGLGLHVFESIGLGIPCLTNDLPPVNELLVDGLNSVSTKSTPFGTLPNGVAAWEPDITDLARGFRLIVDRDYNLSLRKNLLHLRMRRSQYAFEQDLKSLLSEH